MRKLLISLAILGGAAACADPATPETGPRVLGLSASEVVVGETLGLYGQGLSAEELKAVRVTFRGTFTTDDGRAEDVEAQAKGPVLNPIEMASPSEEHVVGVLASIPGYVTAFAEAFPDDETPLSYDNMARAIGAFERKLITPGPFDRFLAGDLDALDPAERRGLDAFLSLGCISCHNGATVGGLQYRKLGQIFPYETKDPGRFNVTGNEADRFVFKVPSLRNVAETGPWFHDGSITSLEEAVRLMGYHQLGLTLEPKQIADLSAFLRSLTGEIDAGYVARPELPAKGPDTPAPDPN